MRFLSLRFELYQTKLPLLAMLTHRFELYQNQITLFSRVSSNDMRKIIDIPIRRFKIRAPV